MSPSRKKNSSWLMDNLNTSLIGSEVEILRSTDSTNEQTKRYLESGASEGLVVMADSQSAGKGRSGRSWHSPEGAGIYLSVLLKPPISQEQVPQLALLAGVAVVSAVNQWVSGKAWLKWPNDILLNNKKLSGILAERVLKDGQSWVVLGIGINVNQNDFPEELENIATSLLIETGKQTDQFEIVKSLLENLDGEYNEYLQSGSAPLVKKWVEHSNMFDREVTLSHSGSTISGTAVGLTDEGSLIILTDAGEKKVFDSGEVSLNI